MKAKMEELGVLPSYSRPRVSNDNAFSESLFRTLKYRPEWPSSGFKSLEDARRWVDGFVSWYNTEHKHSKLRFVTPQERHSGEDVAILAQRQRVYWRRPSNGHRTAGEAAQSGTVSPLGQRL